VGRQLRGGRRGRQSSKGKEAKRTPKRNKTQATKEVEGTMEVTRGGFGFVAVEGMDDVFVAGRDLGGAVYGDRVLVKLLGRRSRGNPEGQVIKVLERGRSHLVGTLAGERGRYILEVTEPLSTRTIEVDPTGVKQAALGSLAYVKVRDWGTGLEPIRTDLEEIIGPADEPRTDYTFILRQFDLDDQFPPAIEAEVEHVAKKASIAPVGLRRDLRHLTVFTIDPKTAKDFDDAISLERLEDGAWRLGVHIADVSLYVKRGSSIDAEAFRRGNSSYFTEGVVPMLPHLLSSDLCSLKPDEDRPAMTVMITLNAKGVVLQVEFMRSLIRSRRRFTYGEVHAILAAGQGDLIKTLQPLKRLTQSLFKRRLAAGSVDFDIPEPLIKLDEYGVPHIIHPSERLDSHRIVEECMLLANRMVAERIPEGKPRPPFFYRVHDEPGKEKIKELSALLKRLRLPGLPRKGVTSKSVRDLLMAMEDSPYRDLIETVTLRSMAKAAYAVDNIGHFGLAFNQYTHFTSPIRRYADLVVHRMVVEHLAGARGKWSVSRDALDKVAIQCSTQERLSLKAERAYQRLKELRFLATRIDKTFDGIISGVIPRGLFIQIKEFLVDGFVSIDRLTGDTFYYDESLYALHGRSTGQILQLGQEVTIKVHDVSIENRLADFLLMDT